MIFVDTNYFLRFLLKDVPRQHQEAKRLFLDGAQGKVKLFTSLVVIFEIYWVLSTFYERNKTQVAGILEEILNLNFIEIENKRLLEEALKIYQKTTLDLEDAFNLIFARSKNAKEFKTFDKKLASQVQQ